MSNKRIEISREAHRTLKILAARKGLPMPQVAEAAIAKYAESEEEART